MESTVTLRAPLTARLADPTAERVRQNHDDRIAELAALPSSGLAILRGIVLQDSVLTLVPHKLGRRPSFVRESMPRGASSTGRIDDIDDGSYDRTKFLGLKASGFGATITVDVQVL